VDLGENVELGTSEAYTTNTTYPDPLGPGSLKDQCKGVKLSLRSKGSASSWILDVRAYVDGVAWRYLVPGSGTRKITGEATSFVLPEGATYWSHHETGAYESNFIEFTAKGSAAIKPVAMPITVELPGGGFACITEANIFGYSGMSIGPRGRILTGVFEDETKGWNLEGNITTPWRIFIAVDSLDALVNQSIVYNVSPPPDPKLFPKGKDADWIKPGRAYWTWNIGGRESANWDRIKGFIDDAASLNCPYYVIDDGWRDERYGWYRNGKNEWASLKEFSAYAAAKNVKLMVWQNSNALPDLAAQEEFFRNVSEAGAVGVKMDFLDGEKQKTLEFYRSCLEICARYKLMINFHGAYKPAGEERTWPNWLTREAVHGMEHGGGSRQHMAALPFTRLVTGPADFTPTDFRPAVIRNSTAGTQLAIAVAYASPLLHWNDSLKSYKAQGPDVFEFIRNKPAVWDETRVLPGSIIGKAALMARRSGKTWYVAAINGTDQDMTHEIKTGFLAAGKWETVSFSDVPGDKTKLSVNKSSVTSASVVNARMSPGGGFVMVIRPAR
jgi:alpha-glucosidase